MSFRYAVYGTGRIGRVHAQLVRSQGCAVVAVGDDVDAAAELEAAHRSAMSDRASVRIDGRSEDLVGYRESCAAAGLVA